MMARLRAAPAFPPRGRGARGSILRGRGRGGGRGGLHCHGGRGSRPASTPPDCPRYYAPC